MEQEKHSKLSNILLALLVVFLWATSWVLIKLGLSDFQPITFAGLRYFLAFLCLLPFALSKKNRQIMAALSWQQWLNLFLLGLLYYTLTQGSQFAGLSVLPAMSVSLILSFTSVFVAGIGSVTLGEKPTGLQWLGLVLNVVGAILYFHPVNFSRGQMLAVGIVFAGMLGNSVSMVQSRKINRDVLLPPVCVTAVSMGFGSIFLLLGGMIFEEPTTIRLQSWLMLGWMAVVNTALAFTLWNKVLQKLQAMEASIINNTISVQIAVLAWVFLGEKLDGLEIGGVILTTLGAVLVQMSGNRIKSPKMIKEDH